MNRNLEDIAKIAGVSRSTVSRVINNQPNVSEDTRRRVLSVIEEHNFRPNIAARALVTQQTRVLSVVIPKAVSDTFTDPYFPTLIQGAMTAASQQEYAVMLWIGNAAEDEERFFQRILSNSLFDGVIVASALTDDPLRLWLQRAGFPYVFIGAPQDESLNYVDVDNVQAGQAAVSHLIRLGYQRIGTLAGPQKLGAAIDRLKGYRLALERAGRRIDNDLIIESQFTEVAGYMNMKKLLQRHVDAVFAASDVIAFGAMRAIREQGLRIPQDVAVIGFDDIDSAAQAFPPLTTVRQPILEEGAAAARVLIDLIQKRVEGPQRVLLNTELIIRDSCGAKLR